MISHVGLPVSRKARKLWGARISQHAGASIKDAHLKNQNKNTASKVVAVVKGGKKKAA